MFNAYYSVSPWRCRAPSHAAAMIDDEVSRQATCRCGQRGMIYFPYSNLETGEYLALMKCPKCKYEEEF